MSKRNFKFTAIHTENLENRQLFAADLGQMGPQPLYDTVAPAAQVGVAQPQAAAAAGNHANVANPNATPTKARANEQSVESKVENKVDANKHEQAVTTACPANTPVSQPKPNTTTNATTGNANTLVTKPQDTVAPVVTSEKVTTPAVRPAVNAVDMALDSLVQDRTLSRTMTGEGEASKAATAKAATPVVNAKPTNVVAPMAASTVAPQVSAAKLPLGSNVTLNLKDTAGKELESIIKALTPSSHRKKVECTEFTVNSKGDVSIKVEIGYKGKIGFIPWKLTVKIELKTNLFNNSKLDFKLKIGKLPGISFGINAAPIKTALTAWIAAHRGSLKV